MSDPALTTEAGSRSPTSPGSRYLIGLMSRQQGLDAAQDKLLARAAQSDEDDYIAVQMELIQTEYLQNAAMISAYLQQKTVVRPITSDGLATIRHIVEQLQAVEAAKTRAHDIVVLVTRLLNEWDGVKEDIV